MKYIFNLSVLFAGLFFWASCSSDYLNTSPQSSITPSLVFDDTEGAKLAVNGICRLMVKQYFSQQGYNGEGTIKLYHGNYPGTHFYVNQTGFRNTINHGYFENTSTMHAYYPWYYYYRIIGNANALIANIDAANGSEADKAYIKAQGLSFRAYGYMMLVQFYCNRWSDSNNGQGKGVVLRLDESTDEMPLSTLGEVYDQIYQDLDDAIALYTSSKLSPAKGDFYSPNINMAYATYSRAALNRQDYEKAATTAAKAREGYPLMSNAEYKSGFNTPNSEWIWGSYNGVDQTLSFYSYFAYIAYNSTASAVRSYPKCISKTLYDKIPATDIRRDLFLDPTGYESSYTASSGEVTSKSELDKKARAAYPGLASNAKVYTYMQFKVSATAMPGVGCLVHFRSAEMYLNEAEAQYYLKQEEAARKLLVELNRNSGRNPEYTCNKTGAELLEEIKTYRYFELWGEGFDLFDTKRWGDPIVRLAYNEGGNFATAFAGTIEPTKNNKWTFRIPDRETNYNDLIVD